MIFSTTNPVWVCGAAVAFVAILASRFHMRAKSENRAKELEQSAALLNVHAENMERFLDAAAAPVSLKRLLIQCSDSLQDEETVLSIAERICSGRPFEMSADARENEDAVRDLNQHDPLLAQIFLTAMVTLTVASMLRWPNSASLVDAIWPKFVAYPQRDVSALIAFARKPSKSAVQREAAVA